MTIKVSLSKPTLKEYIRFTEWSIHDLQKVKRISKSFRYRDECISNKISIKENFIRSFLEVYNSLIYLRDYIHTSEDAIELYCKQFGSPRDLQCYQLINSGAERLKAWGTNDYRQLCLNLSKKLSTKEVEYVIHEYFQTIAYDELNSQDISTFFELDCYDIYVGPHRAYCCDLFEKYHKIYTGLKAEHEYIIKPITLEITKNANSYYTKLYKSMSN